MTQPFADPMEGSEFESPDDQDALQEPFEVLDQGDRNLEFTLRTRELSSRMAGWTTPDKVTLNSEPDTCPICLQGVHPERASIIAYRGVLHGSDSDLEVIHRCPRTECGRVFISRYDSVGSRKYEFKQSLPRTFREPSIEQQVAEISPGFVKIVGQAMQADQMGLDEIAGVGYRKALEFLIKDYCILERPAEKEAICKALLAPCIEQYVSDQNIKQCAKRAAWIGNDETHYIRKWEDRDISDLRLLITLTMNWIHSALMTKQYMAEMNAPKR